MPGYSGTPLAKKLGFKPGTRVALVDVAADVRAELAAAVAEAQIVRNKTGPLDLVLLTTKSRFRTSKKFPVLDETTRA